jgi:hypothetical protein
MPQLVRIDHDPDPDDRPLRELEAVTPLGPTALSVWKPGSPLTRTGTLRAPGGDLPAIATSKRAIRSAPSTGCSAAATLPPPSVHKTASRASNRISPSTSPASAAATNARNSSSSSSRVARYRRTGSPTRARARRAVCRQFASVLPTVLAISA